MSFWNLAAKAVGFVAARLTEDGTWAGLGVFFMVASSIAPPPLDMALKAVAAGCGMIAAALKAKGAVR